MNRNAFFFGSVLAAGVAWAVPQVGDVTMAQDAATRLVTVTYSLDGPAIVTMDVEVDGTSVGDRNLWHVFGDVNCRVAGASGKTFTIYWRPDKEFAGLTGNAVCRLTAWTESAPPPYLVADLVGSQVVRYYTSTNALPGGLLDNPDYRTTKLVMRHLPAKGVTWKMDDSTGEAGAGADEKAHDVTLANDFYIGVFEVTQYQWYLMLRGAVGTYGEKPSYYTCESSWKMRPVEKVSYNHIMANPGGDSGGGFGGFHPPGSPNPVTCLGWLRNKTGLPLHLPSEAQWEFAARAGHYGPNKLGDGSELTDANLRRLARCCGTTTGMDPDHTPAQGGSAVCGSFAPNDYGLYDMNGNVWEWCKDWYHADVTENAAGDPLTSQTYKGVTASARVMKGGGWNNDLSQCRPSRRAFAQPNTTNYNRGFRLSFTIQ